MTEPKIKFDRVTKRYGPLTVLDPIRLDIDPGKTTVLRVLMTLESIDDGVIYIDGKPFNKMVAGGALVVEQGPPQELLGSPNNERARQFLSKVLEAR